MARNDGRLRTIEGILGRPLLGDDRIDAEEALAAGTDPADYASAVNRWELGGALSLLDLGESDAMSDIVQGHTRRARGWLFGRSVPPFSSAEEARAWIEEQVGDGQEAINRENELEEKGLLDECRQRALDAVGPSADACEWSITATAWRVYLPALHPTEQMRDLVRKLESEQG